MTTPTTIERLTLTQFLDEIISTAPVAPNHSHVLVTAPVGVTARARFSALLEHVKKLGLDGDGVTVHRTAGRETLTFGNYITIHFATRRSDYARGWSLIAAVVDSEMTLGQLDELQPTFATTGGRLIRITDGGALWN